MRRSSPATGHRSTVTSMVTNGDADNSKQASDRTRPRELAFTSAARSLKGIKHDTWYNEDYVLCTDDLFGSGLAKNAAPAPYLEELGKVGLYGVFDGHQGRSCAEFVSKNLADAVASYSGWLTLRPKNDCNTGTSSGQDTKKDELIPPRSSPAYGGADTASPEEASNFDVILTGVMKQAICYGFRKIQEDFEGLTEPDNNSGSCAVVALVCRHQVVIANLGDSEARCYSLKNEPVKDGELPCVARTEVRSY